MSHKPFFICLILLSLINAGLYSQNRIVLKKLSHEIVFDGHPNDAAWDEVELLPLMVLRPDYGNEPSEKTEIKIAYDDTYLYAAGKLFDQNAGTWQIQFKRDDWKYNCDWLQLIIDSFNDKENSLTFATSPSGGRTDVAFSNDVSDVGKDSNLSWNTFWDVKTTTDDKGWYVEMRIPFSSLRFQDTNSEVVMGISVMRYISNKNESIVFPRIDKKHGFWGAFKASQAQEFIIKGVKSKKPLYIAPYLLGGFSQSNNLNDSETKYERSDNFDWNVGGDIKYRVSDNLTLDASINTDFAQVEADDQVVNLTRFSLFFPEKRLFFQERRSNFEFNFDDQNRLFYTRKIGINQGNPVGIYGGARVVGRVGLWDVGALSMQTAPNGDLLSENFAVMRLRRQVFNENSYVGAIATNRTDFKGNYNSVYGIDGIFRLFGDDYLKVMLAQSFENNLNTNIGSLDPSRVYFNWERRTLKGIGYMLNYSRAGADYNPGVGFESRENYSKYGFNLFYGWLPEKSWLYNHKIQVSAFQYNRNINGARESAEMWVNWSYNNKKGGIGSLTYRLIYDQLTEDFHLSEDEYIPAGDYSFNNLNATFSTPPSKSMSVRTEMTIGPFYDGWINSVSISPRTTIKNKVELIGTYQYNAATFEARNMQFNSHIFRLKGGLVINSQLSLAAFIQYNSAIDAVLANARFRYNPKEGVDLYIVYNEGYNTDRHRGLPTLPMSNERTIMIKYTHTFIL